MNTPAPEQEHLDLAPVDEIIARYAGEKGALIPILQQAQEVFGFLPRSVMRHIAQKTNTPLQQVFGVATFYSQFYLHRRGKYVIQQCDGTACHVRGASKIIDAVGNEFQLHPGETSEDYTFTYEVVYCLGSCGLAPVAVINDRVMGRLLPKDLVQTIRNLSDEV